MLCSASGDAAGGAAQLQRALDEWGDAAPPFERARATFVLGTVLRRTLRRRESRSALHGAFEAFETLGASLWADRAKRMLGAQEEASLDLLQPLTPAERRVAEIVASGATNRATADQLFVSIRAVEVHLTSIYRKLGIRSRTELAGLLARATATEPDAAQPVEAVGATR